MKTSQINLIFLEMQMWPSKTEDNFISTGCQAIPLMGRIHAYLFTQRCFMIDDVSMYLELVGPHCIFHSESHSQY